MVDNEANTDVGGHSQLQAFESHTGLRMPFVQKVARISNEGGGATVFGVAKGRFPI